MSRKQTVVAIIASLIGLLCFLMLYKGFSLGESIAMLIIAPIFGAIAAMPYLIHHFGYIGIKKLANAIRRRLGIPEQK